MTIDPSGRWVVAGTIGRAVFWPLPERPNAVLPGDGGLVYRLAFTPDGSVLVIPLFAGGGVRLQPIGGGGTAQKILDDGNYAGVAMDPQGRFAVVSRMSGDVVVFPLDGSEPTLLRGSSQFGGAVAVAYDPERELVAAGCFRGPRDEKVIRVWRLRDGSVQVLGPAEDAGESMAGGFDSLEFLADGSLLLGGRSGLRRWRLEDGSCELLIAGNFEVTGVTPDGHTAVVGHLGSGRDEGGVRTLDLATAEVRPIPGFRGPRTGGALSPRGDVVAGGYRDGRIRVGRLSGGDPHMLLGHEATVYGLAFSPDGRRLASVDQGGTIRVWPVPDLEESPFHTLPHDELMARLDTFTNLRVVRDQSSPTVWKLELGPFPGWADPPQW